MHRFLLTGFGRDRPGMVAAVSRLLLDLGANLEDTSMTRLGGQFAMLMLLSDGDIPLSVATIETAIASRQVELGALDLHLRVSEVEGQEDYSDVESERYLIRVAGADRPGIVCSVTSYLADRNINIVDVSSRRLQGTTQAIYLLLLEVVLPAKLTEEQFRQELRALQEQLGLDIQTELVEAMTL